MRDVLEKMRECGKDIKMRDFPHDCGMVDTYGLLEFTKSAGFTETGFRPLQPKKMYLHV